MRKRRQRHRPGAGHTPVGSQNLAVEAFQAKDFRGTRNCIYRSHRDFGIDSSAQLARYVSVPLIAMVGSHPRWMRLGSRSPTSFLTIRDGDALLLLTHGRPYREVLATVNEGKRLGLPIVL